MRNSEKVYKLLFSKNEDSNNVKYIYRIISRLISIKVPWKISHPNIPINCGLETLFIIFYTLFMIFLDLCHHFYAFFGLYYYELGCFLLIFYLKSWQSFAKSSIIPKSFSTSAYIRFNRLAYTCQSLHYLANTLANTDGLLSSDFSYLVSTLIKTNNMLKTNLCHLASTLTNTDDKVDKFIKKRSIISNQLLIPHYQLDGIQKR